MSSKVITADDVKEYLKKVSYKEFSEIVRDYSNATCRDYSDEMQKLVSSDMQSRLEALEINSECPECGSEAFVIKYVKKNEIQYYKCTLCKERLAHIFEKQVYGLVPTEIIYRIALNFILGFSDDTSKIKHNLKKFDALPAAKDGTLEQQLDELYK